jgi:hypothetical protein
MRKQGGKRKNSLRIRERNSVRNRERIPMTDNRTTFRKRLARSMAAMALLAGASALLLGSSSAPALAFGGHGGGGHGVGGHGGFGFHGGGFHRGFGGFGPGFGFGFYPYGYYDGYYPYEGDVGVCYVERQRVKTRYGWRIRRVSICE